MTGLGIVINRASVAGSPVVQPPLYSLGASVVPDHRFIVSRFAAGNGTMETVWPDQGPVPTNAALTGGMATLMQEGSAAQFLRVTGASSTTATFSATAQNTPRTVAMVVRKTNTGDDALELAGYALLRAGNGSWELKGLGSGFMTAGASNANWAFVLAVLDTANPILRVGAVENVTPTALTTAYTTNANLVRSAAAQSTDVVEIATWGSSLNSTDRAAVYAAMQAQYPLLAL